MRTSLNKGATAASARTCGYVRRLRVAVRSFQETQTVEQASVSTRYTVSLRKPLGITLEQDGPTGNILVSDVKPESAAEKQGVAVGDQLIATSGVVYNKELDYAGVWVKAGEEIIRMAVLGETFKTVSAAIRSHPGHIPVTLELQRSR